MQAPQGGVGDFDQGQADAHDQPHRNIGRGLKQEEPGDPLGGVIQRAGGRGQLPPAGQPDQPVPGGVPLDQHEHSEDGDQQQSGDHLGQWEGEGRQPAQHPAPGLLNQDRRR